MDVKDKVLLQLFNKNKLSGTKTFLELNFSLFIVKFIKLGFSASFRGHVNSKKHYLRFYVTSIPGRVSMKQLTYCESTDFKFLSLGDARGGGLP